MALPKKNSRPITVDGHFLRWRYFRRDTHVEALIVVQGEGHGQFRLLGPLSPEKGRTLARYEQVTPSVVEKWVRLAIAKGWDPSGEVDLMLSALDWPSWLNTDGLAGVWVSESLG